VVVKVSAGVVVVVVDHGLVVVVVCAGMVTTCLYRLMQVLHWQCPECVAASPGSVTMPKQQCVQGICG
jgi:hypothetical protein